MTLAKTCGTATAPINNKYFLVAILAGGKMYATKSLSFVHRSRPRARPIDVAITGNAR